MNVTVLPWLDIMNYGSVLQVFAVRKLLEKYAGRVDIINYTHNSRLKDAFSHSLTRSANNLLSYVFFKPNFRKVEPLMNITGSACFTEKDFEGCDTGADIFCTGSDQIWNMANGPAVFGARFLSFLPEGARRFALSSSFGDRIDENVVAGSREWIHKFERISVREDTGLSIIKEQYGYEDAVRLIDPTVAMPAEFWRTCAPKPRIAGGYILIYDLMNNKAFYEYAKALSKKTGLPLVHLCNRFSRVFLCGKSILIPPFFDFITLIDNAKYVLTGSFHATAFSMLLNTEPICSLHSRNPGRLTSFLRLVGAEHRAIKDFSDFDVLGRDTDFESVNTILDRERMRVDVFLSGIFSGCGPEPNVGV